MADRYQVIEETYWQEDGTTCQVFGILCLPEDAVQIPSWGKTLFCHRAISTDLPWMTALCDRLSQDKVPGYQLGDILENLL